MKIHKLFAIILAVLLGAGMLTSCQLSKLFNKDSETTSGETETETQVVEEMDLMNTDLTKYVRLGQYKGIKITVEVPELTEEEFNESITKLLTDNGDYAHVTDRASVPGDTVNIDFEGYMDGVKFEGGTAAGQSIELSENSGYIEGFADGLISVMPGTTVTLNLTFPTDYYEDYAGKAVIFNVKVNYIQGDFIVPELDDAFVTKYSEGKYTTVESFREYYRGKVEADLAAAAESEAYTELWQLVIGNAEILEYPEQQLKYYYNAQKSQYESYAASNNVDYATILSYMGVTEESMNESAKTYVKEDLVFYSIIKAENLSISDDEYKSGVEKYAELAGATAAQLEAYYGKDLIIQNLLWDEVQKQLFMWAVVDK